MGEADVTLPELNALGVLYQYFPPTEYDKPGTETQARWVHFRHTYGFQYADRLEVSPEKLADYEAKLGMFFEEHIHADPEVRYVVDGSGYFDVRGVDDAWIRIAVEPGDLLVLPAGIFHRFTVDSRNYILAVRLFADEPQWVPINRPAAEQHPAHVEYIRQYGQVSPAPDQKQKAVCV
jgi:1,2-dihydroxy-3-keto-5-methylthiopentene dioxygenase